MVRIRRIALASSVIGLLSLPGVQMSAASAATTRATPARAAALAGKTGPFKIGPATSPGSIAMTPNGTLEIVYDNHNTIVVCSMGLGKRSCGHTTYLHALKKADDPFGVPQVFVPSSNHVVVLQATCCDGETNDDLLFTSANGGKTFAAAIRVASLGVSAAALAGSHIVFTPGDTGSLQVQSIPDTGSSVAAAPATLRAKDAFDVAAATYKGGVLVATDFIGSTQTTTYVYYGAKGKDFGSASSYKLVGTFDNEGLLAMSGSALLTTQTKHGSSARLRTFNGHSYGTAHSVPHTSGGGPQTFTVCQAPNGHDYVFLDRAGYDLYDLVEQSTSTGGSKWSKPIKLGNAINSNILTGAVNNTGKGLVLGSTPSWAYPVG
jgi:hypothetical protein